MIKLSMLFREYLTIVVWAKKQSLSTIELQRCHFNLNKTFRALPIINIKSNVIILL